MPRVKKKDHEKLTDANIAHVISLLSGDKPITKKLACEILNISYNPSRLNNIIDGYNERKEYQKKRREHNRGRPASDMEVAEAIRAYLRGEGVTNIAKGLYRSPGFVKTILDRIGVPTKPSSKEDRSNVGYLPEQCVATEFRENELAWSAVYHAVVRIKHELSPKYTEGHKGLLPMDYEAKYGSKCYAVTVMEETENEYGIHGGFSAYCLAYDLGKLTHLEKYVDLEKI